MMQRGVIPMSNLRAAWALLPMMLFLLAPGLAAGQSKSLSLFQQDDQVPEVLATFESHIEPATARPGEHVRLIVTARIIEGWYTYSAVPQGEFAPPPTKLTITNAAFEPLGPLYEINPTVKKDKVFGLDLAYHTGAVRFYKNLRLPEGAASGRAYLEGNLRYQVCNNKICTPPTKEPINAGIVVEEGPVRPAFAYMQRTIDYLDGNGNFQISADSLESALAGGLAAFLLLAVGFGLLSLLTPCVFPMIPITVSFFTGEAQRGQRGVLKLALLFAAGIVVTYTGLGLILTFLIGAGGVSQFATSPWTNLAVAAFFALFAFSLMGLYEFALPAGWVQGLDRKSRMLKGPTGVILMGIAFTATSFTCTMPFVGTLLIAATQGQLFWPLIGMLVFSAVFATPFFLLALFPGFVVNLRGTSGNWLVQLKVALGLVELMAAFKFVSNADLIWQWGIFNREVTLAVWAGLAAATALMLLGLLPWPGVQVGRRALPRQLIGGAFVVLTVYLVLGVSGRELDSYTESYAPPRLANAAAMTAGGRESLDKVHNLPWLTSLDAGLVLAKETGRPIFIDFTGYTCVNCRWMEKNIFAADEVYEAFQNRFVLVQLYTDGGENAAVNQNLQIERFRTVALPYYVILAPDNSVLAKHAGIVATPGEFLTWLERGRALLVQQTKAQPCATAQSNVAQAGGKPAAKC